MDSNAAETLSETIKWQIREPLAPVFHFADVATNIVHLIKFL